jgi:glucose/arabinose dehydrogenase
MTCWNGACASTLLALVAAGLAACGPGPRAQAPTYGPRPDLVSPAPQTIPTIEVAKAVGWAAGAGPTPAAGFEVKRFADGLDHPRWLYVLSNGDVLVAESATRPRTRGGLEAVIANAIQNTVGAQSGSPDKIVLLRDADGDGLAEQRYDFITGLNQPFGMALLVNALYVANTDALLRFPYTDGQTKITAMPQLIMSLPNRADDNGHWTRNVVVKLDGTKLYVSVGSSSNIADHGIAAEARRAAILEVNPGGGGERVFASGLRNPVGMAWEPTTGALWVAVNERDMLGDDLVPDYMTSVKDGGFYGWPYSYFGGHRDPRVKVKPPAGLVERAIAPDYALGAHTASLGLAFYTANLFPPHFKNGAFVGQHGSWNRSEPAGYKVVFVPFENGKPSGPPEDFLTGFLSPAGEAQGRPVGVALDTRGALLVSDDVGGAIWRVTPRVSR